MILINTNKDCIENIVKFCILICSFVFYCLNFDMANLHAGLQLNRKAHIEPASGEVIRHGILVVVDVGHPIV